MSESDPGQPGIIQPGFKGRITTPGAQDVNDFHGRSDVDSSIFAQHHTLGLRRNQASRGDHDHDGVNSKRVASITTKFLTDNQTYTVNSTLVDIPGWSIPMEANARYAWRLYLILRTSGANDLFASLGFTLPAGATLNYTLNHMSSAGVPEGSINRVALTSAAVITNPAFAIDSLTDIIALPTGFFLTAGTAGNAQFRFSKVSGTGNVILVAGSFLEMFKVIN